MPHSVPVRSGEIFRRPEGERGEKCRYLHDPTRHLSRFIYVPAFHIPRMAHVVVCPMARPSDETGESPESAKTSAHAKGHALLTFCFKLANNPPTFAAR
jgi:hypothetical protein